MVPNLVSVSVPLLFLLFLCISYTSVTGTQVSIAALLGVWGAEVLQGHFPRNSGGEETGPYQCDGCLLPHLLQKSSIAHQTLLRWKHSM